MNEAVPSPAAPASPSQPPLPDRLSVDPQCNHHVPAGCEHGVGVRFHGTERSDVEAYCLSGGWIMVPGGTTGDRKGHPLRLTLEGTVDAFYR